MYVVKTLKGFELDQMVREGKLDSDTRFRIKDNAHPAGEKILVYLDAEQTSAIRVVNDWRDRGESGVLALLLSNQPCLLEE